MAEDRHVTYFRENIVCKPLKPATTTGKLSSITNMQDGGYET
jgi:hypothetical protein